ncbi:MAG TPA: adenylate/guanylate cyclase domain-containing protein [Chitinophagaceae bacterium]|nr:adenylate/guanylate cyclase domain-containing protein [Chitinophagaceae bacterium]
MARINLKHIIGKKTGDPTSVLSLIDQLNGDIRIEDDQGKFIAGIDLPDNTHRWPVMLDDENLGWVIGNEKADSIASLLSLLAKKETERKKLGAEVLSLYQEVNMVFNFSDKLAQAIGPTAIAEITVQEAMHLKPEGSAIVTLWDETNKQLDVPATAGEDLFNKERVVANASRMLKIGLSGMSDIMSDLSLLKESGIIHPSVQSVMYTALKVKHRVMGAIILASERPMHYAAADLKFLTTLALQSSSAIESALLYEKNIREAHEREEAMRKIYEVAGKFVPYEFIGSLGHDVITDVRLGDQVEKVVTVLFTDIRDYTSLSERMSPEETFRFVCDYNETLGPIIRQHNGFINQYLGDSIMALFPGNAMDALLAAVEMKKSMVGFNSKRSQNNQPPIRIGIGMHTGALVMGITGDKNRLDATTISDTVNTASRIESLTKYYKADILLSDATLQQLGDSPLFKLRYLGQVQVKGKQEPIGIHECFSGSPEEEIKIKENTLPLFNEGMQDYLNRSFASAIRAFESVTELNPADQTTAFFCQNATRYLQKGVPDGWSGVVEMMSK